MREDQGYAFLIFREADAALVGGLTISNIRRGVAQSASVGYWMGLPHVGRGHMTDAVRAVVPFAFSTLGLHRLEAACLPHNAASARVLEKSGFRREGTARRYLKINDVWQDHDLYALLHDDART
jgi:ribosomal-protein-alanine N-acetyltransferase